MLTDGRTDGRTDDGRKVITIAHPEQSSGELKRSEKDLFDDDYAIFFLIFFIKASVVGTHLNCIDLSMQFK